MLTPQQLLAFAVLSGVVGAAYQFSQNKTDATDGFNIAQRIFSMLVGAFLSAMLAYLFIIEWKSNGVLIAILNLFFGTGAEKIIRLAMASQNSAKSPEEFIDKWKRAKQAFSQDKPQAENDSTTPPQNESNP